MSIQDRYRQLIEIHTNGNVAAFAKKIGVAKSNIQNMIGSRGSNPSFEVICQTLITFESLNARWLITGEGEMDSIETGKPFVTGATLVEESTPGYVITKEALDMIKDLAGENAVLKHKLESGEQSKRVKPKVHGDNATEH